MPEPRPSQDVDPGVVPSPSAPQVALAGLPPVYAHGLQALLRAAGLGCTTVPDLAELAPLLAGAQPYVVVVLGVPASTLVPAEAVVSRHAVVALVDAAALETCVEALRSGLTSVITSTDAPDDVLTVLRGAARGRTVLPREVVRALCAPGVSAPPALTETERAWVRRLAGGATVAGLARSCGYSEREMYRRLSSLYLRLGARNRTQALLLAERHGLLDERRPGNVIRLP